MMQKTGIEWCTHTWNPMTGCKHGCPYCYARKTAENPYLSRAFPHKFKPHFYPERLREPARLKRPAIIFADSMSDLFGAWWPEDQISRVLNIMDCMRGAHWHKFVVLTKNPRRMAEMLIMSEYPGGQGLRYLSENFRNVYFGTSVTGENPDGIEAAWLYQLHDLHEAGFKTVISFEPLLQDPAGLLREVGNIIPSGISWADWIIIGGQTKPIKVPPHEWVSAIVKQVAPFGSPVFLKDNLDENLALGTFEGQLAWWNSGHPLQGTFYPYPKFPADLLPIAQAWGKA